MIKKIKGIKSGYRGMTGVEALVYLAIFSVIFISMIQYLFGVGRSNQIAKESILLEKNGLFLTQHMRETISESVGIDDTLSLFDTDNGVLTLNMSNDPEPLTNAYSLNNGRVQFSNSSGDNYFLTQNGLIVSSIRFEPVYDLDDNLVGVRLMCILQSEDLSLSREFETSYIIRPAL